MKTRMGVVVMMMMMAACNGSSTPDAGSGACPTGSGTVHGAYLDADETWSAAGNPHRVTSNIRVNGSATLTLGPCAQVVVDPGIGFSLGFQGATSKLVSQGTQAQPVEIKGSDPASPWLNITVAHPGAVSLAWTTISGAGSDPLRFGTSISARGDSLLPLKKVLTVDHVNVNDSAGVGVLIEWFGGFSDTSTALLVHGAGKSDATNGAALRVATPSVSTIPPGTYTGNARDEITIDANQDINDSDTFHGRGVPYVLLTDLKVRPATTTAPAAHLTIEAGSVLRFPKDSMLVIGSGSSLPSTTALAALTVSGTAANPVVFTSAVPTPAAGDWRGIFFKGWAPTGSSIDNAVIEYAGADCLCNGFSCATGQSSAVNLWYTQPATAFITNTTFAHIAGNGVMSGWVGVGPSLLTGNTFTDVSGCHQTLWRDQNNACPTPNPQCL